MKAVTGNRLSDGVVVYLTDKDQWSERFSCAAGFSDDDARSVLAAAQTRVTEIADAYLIDVDDSGALEGRAVVRETIRTKGPTVRPDLARREEARP
jgi:hypothetical protein